MTHGYSLKDSCQAVTDLVIYLSFAEKGEFLALDLGGSKFKVLQVKVSENGKRSVQMESETFVIPEEIINGRGSEVITAFQTSFIHSDGFMYLFIKS